jgi:heme/copper-type cytochrome/quinol oxidase subunit 3
LVQSTLTIDHGPAAPVDIAHGGGGGEHPTTTGIDSRKVLMWTFLGSECLFFGTLIGTYLAYRDRNTVAPFPHAPYEMHGEIVHGIFDIPYTSISAFVLLMSSLTMVLALASLQRGSVRGMRVWLTATALLGITFLGGQFYEFTTFYREGLSLSQNIFGTTFFVLTGFHGGHVTIGVIWLLSIVGASFRGHMRQDNALMLEISGLYWHFVDIVWIIIFTVVYLVPVAAPAGH